MSTLKVASVKDLAGQGGFSFSSGSITANGTLTVTNLQINGTISGSSGQIIPSQSGQSGKFLTTDGTNMSWGTLAGGGGPISINTYNNNTTWNKPSGVKRIWVKCTGGGGGSSGYGETAGAGAHTEQIIDVANINSINVTVGGEGNGVGYSSQGGNGGTSSFGNYCSSGGGQGANRQRQHSGSLGGSPNQGAVQVYGGSGDGHKNSQPGMGFGGTSFWGGAAPTSHFQQQWAHNYRSHAAWGAGGSSGRNSERGGNGRQGYIVVYNFN